MADEVQTYHPKLDWPKSAVRVAFGIIWLIDASFKWMPAFRDSYLDILKAAADGQPGWLAPWFNFWLSVVTPHVTFFWIATAAIETAIAVALIAGFARKSSYIAATIFSLLIWSTAEAFGGPYTAGATDVGTGVIYALVFLTLLALNAHEGTSKYSVDYLIEKHWPAWSKVAEIKT